MQTKHKRSDLCYQVLTRHFIMPPPLHSSFHSPSILGCRLPGAGMSPCSAASLSLLVSIGSLLLDCAREPPESKVKRNKKCVLLPSALPALHGVYSCFSVRCCDT